MEIQLTAEKVFIYLIITYGLFMVYLYECFKCREMLYLFYPFRINKSLFHDFLQGLFVSYLSSINRLGLYAKNK